MEYNFPIEPIQFAYASVAIMGGVARYMNTIAQGATFNVTILVASAIVSGFSGFMFALVGHSLALPQSMIYMMAGVGGFFGEQTMKFCLEVVKKKIK